MKNMAAIRSIRASNCSSHRKQRHVTMTTMPAALHSPLLACVPHSAQLSSARMLQPQGLAAPLMWCKLLWLLLVPLYTPVCCSALLTGKPSNSSTCRCYCDAACRLSLRFVRSSQVLKFSSCNDPENHSEGQGMWGLKLEFVKCGKW